MASFHNHRDTNSDENVQHALHQLSPTKQLESSFDFCNAKASRRGCNNNLKRHTFQRGQRGLQIHNTNNDTW